jgi:hypothetical protein
MYNMEIDVATATCFAGRLETKLLNPKSKTTTLKAKLRGSFQLGSFF